MAAMPQKTRARGPAARTRHVLLLRGARLGLSARQARGHVALHSLRCHEPPLGVRGAPGGLLGALLSGGARRALARQRCAAAARASRIPHRLANTTASYRHTKRGTDPRMQPAPRPTRRRARPRPPRAPPPRRVPRPPSGQSLHPPPTPACARTRARSQRGRGSRSADHMEVTSRRPQARDCVRPLERRQQCPHKQRDVTELRPCLPARLQAPARQAAPPPLRDRGSHSRPQPHTPP